MAEEIDYYLNKKPGKTYMSRRLVISGERKLRHASKVIDSPDDYEYIKEKEEVVLRQTEGKRKEIIAKFLEDDRGISVVTIQSFNPSKGNPLKTHFSFIGSEIGKLIEFFHNVKSYEFENSEGVNITDEELKKIILSQGQARSLVIENEPLFRDVVRNEITSEDVVALGYRKKQLNVFARLIEDSEYFAKAKDTKQCHGDESLWQKFFEKNQWIFGYGLNYLYVSGFEDRKLEQIVQGSDLLNKGKRVDALMMTKGVISSLCFVEIKTHKTKLLSDSAYRPGCWAPSTELCGAVAQVQTTVVLATRNLYEYIKPVTSDGDPTGEEVFNYKPKAFIVIGNLDEFVTPHGINKEKLRSFELYRNSINDVDILTFDELFERSRFIVEAS